MVFESYNWQRKLTLIMEELSQALYRDKLGRTMLPTGKYSFRFSDKPGAIDFEGDEPKFIPSDAVGVNSASFLVYQSNKGFLFLPTQLIIEVRGGQTSASLTDYLEDPTVIFLLNNKEPKVTETDPILARTAKQRIWLNEFKKDILYRLKERISTKSARAAGIWAHDGDIKLKFSTRFEGREVVLGIPDRKTKRYSMYRASGAWIRLKDFTHYELWSIVLLGTKPLWKKIPGRDASGDVVDVIGPLGGTAIRMEDLISNLNKGLYFARYVITEDPLKPRKDEPATPPKDLSSAEVESFFKMKTQNSLKRLALNLPNIYNRYPDFIS